jgi:hypothetical protein
MLGLIPWRLWAYGAAVGAIIGTAIWWHHTTYQAGYKAATAKYEQLYQAAKDQADAETARLRENAHNAEVAHAQEISDLRAYRLAHPVVVRLCGKPSGGGVPQAGTAVAGNDGTGTASGDVLEVPAGDSGGRDIGGMLDLLAGKADAVSAELREYQARYLSAVSP